MEEIVKMKVLGVVWRKIESLNPDSGVLRNSDFTEASRDNSISPRLETSHKRGQGLRWNENTHRR